MKKEKSIRFKRKYFEMIKSGDKTLECRIKYPGLAKIKTGQIISFFWESQSLKVKIISIRQYKTFKEMLNNEVINHLVPKMNYNTALKEYESIYPKWKINKFGGLIVFEFSLV